MATNEGCEQSACPSRPLRWVCRSGGWVPPVWLEETEHCAAVPVSLAVLVVHDRLWPHQRTPRAIRSLVGEMRELRSGRTR